MENPADHMMRAWREFAATLGRLSDGTEPDTENDIAEALFQPMQAQAALFEQALRMFREEQISAREHLVAPLTKMIEQFEEVATSLRASGEALVRAGELMDKQATAMEGGVAVARELRRTMSWPPAPGEHGGARPTDERDEGETRS